MKSLRVVVRHYGGPEVLEIVEEDAPHPASGELRVRTIAAGVSFAELLMREGIHPEKTILPFTPGWDIVGIVDEAGERASHSMVGKMVAALPVHGGYAQFICLPEDELTPVSTGVDPAEAVSLVLNYVTAYQMMHRLGHASPGQRALFMARPAEWAGLCCNLAAWQVWRCMGLHLLQLIRSYPISGPRRSTTSGPTSSKRSIA